MYACDLCNEKCASNVGGRKENEKNAMFSLVPRPKKISKQEHCRDMLPINW